MKFARFVLLAIMALCTPYCAFASTNHGPINANGVFNDLASMEAAYKASAIILCQQQQHANCTNAGIYYGIWGVDNTNSKANSTPPLGAFSGRTQWIVAWVHYCDGTDCSKESGDYWSTMVSSVCPAGKYWETFRDGHSTCVPGRDKYLDKNTCTNPGFTKPIFPFTGAEQLVVNLGARVGNLDLKVSFDSRTMLPELNGQATWVLPSPVSFGPQWESNFAETYIAEGPNSNPGTAYSSIALQLGDHERETMAPANVADACGGTGGSGVSGAYESDVGKSRHFYYAGTGANAFLLDQHALTESWFGQSGSIIVKAFADGGQLNYAYSTAPDASAPIAGLLETVTDSFGRKVSLTYEQSNPKYPPHIRTLTYPDGAVARFDYELGSGELQKITWPDQSFRQFVYERTDLPWATTGVIDEAGGRYVTVGYDAQGRGFSSEVGLGVQKYIANYGTDPSTAPQWQIDENFIESVPVVCRIHSWITPPVHFLTDPKGQPFQITSTTINGMPAFSGQTQPAGSGCTASSSNQGYDGNGNVILYDDFNGNRSCYAYDLSRNLRTVSVEGMPSSKACAPDLISYAPSASDLKHPERKTTTVWHPDWSLKAREAEPKKVTTWVYNGQPDPIAGGTASCAPTAPALPDGKPIAVLCARYEQATTDATGELGLSATTTGPARAWTYDYNQFGQVLSETTPKLSPTDALSHKTTYAYYGDTSMSGNVGHTIGDLQSVTNPLGQVTSYTSYDGAGRLLSSTDPNGVVTTQSYWPRGWIKSQTLTPPGSAAPQVTTYDYWPTGLLKTVTLPDVSTLNYAYDDAHRLTDITDSAGNKIHYVLDNSGNRTSEQVSDASGNLASTVTRVFDALNRVQSQTGLAH